MKAELRQAFHPQLKSQVEPFIRERHWGKASTLYEGHRFVSPAHKDLHTAVDLDILLLTASTRRPVGDLDNRLKTLIDGLTRPNHPQQMSGFLAPEDGEPTYCLLDDDSLVQRIILDGRRWHAAPTPEHAFVVVTARIVFGDSADMSGPVSPTMRLVL